MEKMNGTGFDPKRINVDRLRDFFPEAFADGKVDLSVLASLLGESIEADDEKFCFNWVGKKAAIRNALTPSSGSLLPVPEKSLSFDETANLYIEGDNLEVLKVLAKTYHGKVKLIYIDPPYNTGHDFVYSDDYVDSIGNYLALSKQLGRSNPETSGRYHTDWLNMMYPRLKLANEMLSDDGSIFISIDSNEFANLKKICDEIFGEQNFVNCISWQKTYAPKNNSTGIPDEVEYILVYSKNEQWSPKRLARTDEMNARYQNPDNDKSAWKSSDPCAPGAVSHQGMVYAIQSPFTGEYLYPYIGGCWRYEQSQLLEIMNGWTAYHLEDIGDADRRAKICGITPDQVRSGVKAIVLSKPLAEAKADASAVLQRGQWPVFYFTKNGEGGLGRKTYLEGLVGKLPTNLWVHDEVGHNDESKKELKKLFGGDAPFDTPKPVRLLSRIIEIAADPDSIVMDFFSGSATTAEAVMRANAKDGGKRKFILVQLPEKSESPDYDTLCDVGETRIKKAASIVYQELTAAKESAGLLTDGVIDPDSMDLGFKVFRLDSSNIIAWDGTKQYSEEEIILFNKVIKDDRSALDVAYEIMLKYGVFDKPLTEKDVNGKKMFSVDNDAMIICLADQITTDDVMAIIKLKPSVVVFKEAGFKDDNEKMNADYTLKRYIGEGEIKVLCI